MTTPLTTGRPGPASPPAATAPAARRAAPGQGDAFAALLGTVHGRPDETSGQDRSDRLDRGAAHERGAGQRRTWDSDDRVARERAAERRDDAAAHRPDDGARREALRRSRSAERQDAAHERHEAALGRQDAAQRRRDSASVRSERSALRRGPAEERDQREGTPEGVESTNRSDDPTAVGSAHTGASGAGADSATDPAETAAGGGTAAGAEALEEPGAHPLVPEVVVAVLPEGAPAVELLDGHGPSQTTGVAGAQALAGTATGPAGAAAPAGALAPGLVVPGEATVPMVSPGATGATGATGAAAPTVPVPPGDPVVPSATAGEAIDVTFLDPATVPAAAPAAVPATGATAEAAAQPVAAPLVDQEPTAVMPAETAAGGPDVTLASASAPAAVAERGEPPLGALGAADATLSGEAVSAEDALLRTNIGATVADLARAAQRDGSGATRVVIRLDPPELGTVTVAVTVRAGEVRVNLLAADVAAVAALDARRTDIDHALADSGLSLGGFDVRSDSRQGQEQQHGRDRAWGAGRAAHALGPDMDFGRAAAVDRAARGVWL